ncbi:ATP-grasp domain-containing protein [Photobacterium leiognathi]|uniref:ATP-grasp domain-containing protein n=1 Tax=Photobacterium leiognathi TaxID=553611 RepID=UPI00273527AD|nr:ATP-grasp domain-containing protein [Photobacterium leiognathi]
MFLKNIFEQYKVTLFIPTSEAEIKAIFDFGLVNGELFGVPVLITNEKTALIALDKLETANALKLIGVNAPWTELATSQPRELPCIFKPRSGQGSKGLKVVRTPSEAQSLFGSDKYIWQELLLPDDQEFTCGVYRCATGECRSILMRRTLSGGFTNKGEVVKDPIIEHYISTIAEELDIQGAINFQLRLTNKGPMLFEVNPRLSSTVMFRHKLGFTDLVWAIEDILGLPLSQYQEPKAGTKFYRGIQEYIK